MRTLLSFNAGVELAQALFFALCIFLIAGSRRLHVGSAGREDHARLACAYGVGSVGFAMFLSRASLLLQGTL